MSAVTRVGDPDLFHCSSMRRATGNATVMVNGRPVSCQGDVNTPHLKPAGKDCKTHAAAIAAGSPTVKAGGRGVGRVGDSISGCTAVAGGSSSVFAG